MSALELRLAFAGTPELAATILQAILDDETYGIERVYTRPDRPAGRGRRHRPSPVKLLADQHKIPIRQPQRPAEIDADQQLAELDAFVVAAYGMILPENILTRPRWGCINVHASLLPRWRGAAPIQRAIQAGDEETGISIMRMDAGLDTGNILLQRSCPIHSHDTAGSLHARLAVLGASALLEALHGLAENSLQERKQDEARASYAGKISKEEAKIDWSQSAGQIERNIRAFNPAPVAHSSLNNVAMRIWAAGVLDGQNCRAAPGTVLGYSREGIDVATGDFPLRILSLQLPGKKIISAQDFYNAHPDFMS